MNADMEDNISEPDLRMLPGLDKQCVKGRDVQLGTEYDSGQEQETNSRTFTSKSWTESEQHLDTEDKISNKMALDRWTDGDDGSLADDEEEDDEDEEEDEHMDEETCAFMPTVTIVQKKAEKQTETENVRIPVVQNNDVISTTNQTYQETAMKTSSKSSNRRCMCCGEMLRSLIFLMLGALLFPLLVWGGYELLPFEPPKINSSPIRLMYTLRCVLFSSFPIILGVFVYGVSWLKFSTLNPLFDGRPRDRHTVVHMNFVQDSLHLLLIFFVQLSVISTYIENEALKVVPLLTIVFTFGRLIYWVTACFSSSVRVLGFSLSFLPIIVLMGFNLYYTCSSIGNEAVFSVAPPTTAPPPKIRWWG